MTGDAKLLALGTGNPKSQISYLGNMTKTFLGMATAIISKGDGKASITVETEDGKKKELTIG